MVANARGEFHPVSTGDGFLATAPVAYEEARDNVNQRSTVHFLEGNVLRTEPNGHGKTVRTNGVFPPLERYSGFDKNYDTIPTSHATRSSGKLVADR